MSREVPELEEVFIGGLKLVASPKLIATLEKRRKENPELDRLLRTFDNPKLRRKMFWQAWKWLDSQIEHRLKQGGAPFIAIWGDRGLGKSEAMALIGFRLMEAYEKFLGIEAVPALARNPSDINDVLAQATIMAIACIVFGDETEEEIAQGSATEEKSFIDNVETIRVLLHSVIRCANRYKKLKIYSYYCDFCLEVIFRDDTNEVNYAILYVVDEEVKGDHRIPLFIINLPLHDEEWWRTFYEGQKFKDQVVFTESGGRRSKVRRKLLPWVKALVRYCKKQGLEVGRGKDIGKSTDLLSKLIFHVKIGRVWGDKWIPSEQKLICEEAFDRLLEHAKERADKESDERFKDHVWVSDFTWQEKIADMMEDHPEYSKYHLYYVAMEIMMLNPNTHEKQFSEVTGTKKSTNNKWVKRYRFEDLAFKGWEKERRAHLHESFVASKFRQAGWHVQEKERFSFAGLDYEEDMLIVKDGQEVWINAKCGSGSRTYVKEEYTTTYILANSLEKEAYIIYLDAETGIHEVHLPGESFAVGTGKSSAETADSADPSTPFLLLRALASTSATQDIEVAEE